jgi:membrane-bound ClpP family serine protease
VLPPYNEVTVRKSLSCAEQKATKSGLIDLAAKSERDIVKIRTRRGT